MASLDHRKGSPAADGGAAASYIQAVRRRPLLVVAATVAALVASLAWGALRSPDYEASAQILLTPLPQDDRTFLGMQILRDAGDPTRTVQTAATLVRSPRAAELTAARLGGGWDARRVLDHVAVEPAGESNILSVSGKASDAGTAARLANEFANGALTARAEALRAQVANAIVQVRSRLKETRHARRRPAGGGELLERLDELETFRAGQDPTLSLSQPAIAPRSPAGAPAWLVAILSMIAGLGLGSGAALLAELRSPRVRDEQEALALYELPLLARIPDVPGAFAAGSVASPASTAPAVREGFRSVQVQLDQGEAPLPRALLVTSPSAGDGKTTCAVNLAFALVSAGHRVILVDLDLRKPDVGKMLGVGGNRGLVSLTKRGAHLSELLVQVPHVAPLRVAACAPGDVVLLEALTARLPDIIAEAKGLADYVILDTPPLGEVSDALRAAMHADELLLVMRPGHTDRGGLQLVSELLERSGLSPRGAIVVGGQAPTRNSYYGYGLVHENGAHPGPPVGAPHA